MKTERKRYRALRGLSYPTDPKIIKRIRSGEKVPFKERKMKDVVQGEIVDDIPYVSVPWLLEKGVIEEVEADG